MATRPWSASHPKAGNGAHDLAEVVVEDEVGFSIQGGWIVVDDHQPGIQRTVVRQSGGRVNRERRPEDQHQIGQSHGANRCVPVKLRQHFPKEGDVGFEDPAANTVRDIAVFNRWKKQLRLCSRAARLAAAVDMVAMHGVDGCGTCPLVVVVDVLGNDRDILAPPLPIGQRAVRGV